MGANPTLPTLESPIPCSTSTQFPFCLGGLSHQALRFALSLAITEMVSALGGVRPSLLGTCIVAAQKTAPTKKKHMNPRAVVAVAAAMMDFRDKATAVYFEARILHT